MTVVKHHVMREQSAYVVYLQTSYSNLRVEEVGNVGTVIEEPDVSMNNLDTLLVQYYNDLPLVPAIW